MRAGARDELRRALSDPGFTPGARHVGGLVELLGDAPDDATADEAERALARMGPALVEHAAARLSAPATPPVARARLALALGRAALGSRAAAASEGKGEAEARAVDLLLGALGDDDTRVRRAAARALGKVRDAELARTRVEPALLAAHEAATDRVEREALARALGHVGGEAALAALRSSAAAPASPASASSPASSASSASARVARAAVEIERRVAREAAPGAIDPDARAVADEALVFRARGGLEALLAGEIEDRLGGAWKARAGKPGSGAVLAVLPRGQALARALEPRLALDVAFRVPRAEDSGANVAESVASALTSEAALRAFSTWTRGGAARFRLAFPGGGKRRALVWRVAELVARARAHAAVVNDPVAATWEARVVGGAIELEPRSPDPDPRFAWRVRDVPAASHPTIAAALARVAAPSEGETIWDPFVGSGAELVEVARLARPRALFGTDLEERALDAARANLDAAGIADLALLARADATAWAPPASAHPVDLVVTNPPMGRRVHRRGDLDAMLEELLGNAARALGGPVARLVWLSPFPAARWARVEGRTGLRVERVVAEVDLGGYRAELQVLRKIG